MLVEGDSRWSAQEIKSNCVEIRQQIVDTHDVLIRNISICKKGAIEKTSSGKKRRKVIRQRLLDGEVAMLPAAESPLNQQQSRVYEHQTSI